mmetsp:Transcript_9090/g.27577  ORF Transcript_9090/g.27577 Transcript_9090/m.27577 type:complete len:106 (+) Transcript_9090:3-320(+)
MPCLSWVAAVPGQRRRPRMRSNGQRPRPVCEAGAAPAPEPFVPEPDDEFFEPMKRDRRRPDGRPPRQVALIPWLRSAAYYLFGRHGSVQAFEGVVPLEPDDPLAG